MLSHSTIQEVSSKWATRQQIAGPILTLPLIFRVEDKDELREVTRHLHILPEDLQFSGSVNPEKLRRGIYEVAVYRSQLKASGRFELTDATFPQLVRAEWDRAFITLGISDLRGIENQITLNWNNQTIEAEPGSLIPQTIQAGVTFPLPDLSDAIGQVLDFSFDLNFQGSQNLSFLPLGKITDVALSSPWPSPAFNGAFLPDERQVSDNGFDASWKVLQLNRNYPQSWLDNQFSNELFSSSFGVDLLLPIGNYQKSMRSAKYAILTIALTFLVFFLVEVLNKRKIHPFQYTLVGLALCLFYILLISLSEHITFNLAYLISAWTIVTMITLYSLSIFKNAKLSLTLAGLLVLLYGFLFVTLQMQDFALLMGSLGLVAILSLTMYFTRQIDWYNLKPEEEKS